MRAKWSWLPHGSPDAEVGVAIPVGYLVFATIVVPQVVATTIVPLR